MTFESSTMKNDPVTSSTQERTPDWLADLANMESLHKILTENFSSLDKDESTRIDSDELGDAALAAAWPRDEKMSVPLGFMVSSGMQNEIAGSHSDQFIFENEISQEDLRVFGDRIKEYKEWRSEQKQLFPNYYDMVNYVNHNFKHMDTDENGWLDRDEVFYWQSGVDPDHQQEAEFLSSQFEFPNSPYRTMKREDFESSLDNQYLSYIFDVDTFFVLFGSVWNANGRRNLKNYEGKYGDYLNKQMRE